MRPLIGGICAIGIVAALLVAGCSLLSPDGAAVAEGNGAQSTLDSDLEKAWNLAEAGQHQEAYDLLKPYMVSNPDDLYVSCYIGDAAVNLKLYEEATGYLERCVELAPGVTAARTELVKLYEIEGDRSKRDAAYRALMNHYRSLSPAEQQEQREMVRDVFEVKGFTVVVKEYLDAREDVSIDIAPVYSFFLLPPGETKSVIKIDLNYEGAMTRLGRNNGSIGPEDDWYFLDLVSGIEHKKMAQYLGRPSYDKIKPVVAAAFEARILE